MKRIVSWILTLVMLCSVLPRETMIVSAVESSDAAVPTSDIDLFVFAGQSNMMGAAVLEPEVDTFTENALEYKYMPRLRGAETGAFVEAQNPAGEWHYRDLNAAYGDYWNDLSYPSTLSNYSANTYFCPAMRNGTKGFSAQSEADTYPSASLPPYFVTEYASYGHSSVYAHMAKGAVNIVHYFTEEMMTRYNSLISEYNSQNSKAYSVLTTAGLSGAGDAFDDKFNAMLEDYAAFAPDNTLENKCFVWLQGEGDSGNSYIEYKFKLRVLWEHLQELGFTHFFVLRVGYWGSTGIRNVIKAQEDFCAENENCHIVTRAPSLIPHPGATTANWWIREPSAEYEGCRDSYLVDSSNHHFNEKAMQIFAERAALNVHRILHLGLDPILEEENIQGMPTEEDPDTDLPENTTPYTSYTGTEAFCNSLSVSRQSDQTWAEQTHASAASTDLIPVSSADSVWLQYVFFKSEAHAVGGFYDADGKLVAPLYFQDFGFAPDANTGGVTAFQTPEASNRVSIAAIEAATGKQITFVRFTAWQASAGGHANTEARIYHTYTEAVTAPTCTEQGYTTYTCECGDSYVDDYVDATGEHTYENGTCTGCGEIHPDLKYYQGKTISIIGDSISTYGGVSNNAEYNSTIGGNRVFFPAQNITLADTWWMQTAEALGMELCVNNSWSASAVLNRVISQDVGSEAYLNRCINLHNDHTGQEPDVIVVFMGTNDFTFHGGTLGTADIDYDDLLKNRLDAPKTTCEAYAVMLDKIQQRYPNAEIYCMNLFLRRIPQIANHNPVSGQPTAFNDELGKIIRRFECKLVDLEGLVAPEAEIFDRYFADNVHPNAFGMDLVTEALIRTMLGEDVEIQQYSVQCTLASGITTDGPTLQVISEGADCTVTLRADAGAENLRVTVTMGGVDITGQVWQNGVIHIAAVTGDVVIDAKADVTLNSYLQQLPAELCAGTNLWTSLTPEHLFYTGTEWGLVNSVPNAHSITFPVQPGERIFVSSLGKAGENGYGANGVRITWFRGEDVLSSKTLYIEDRIITVPEGATAVNVPMYTGESKWEVYLLDREHSYTSTVTDPTCTEQGYTTYTCECGDSYVSDYLDATDHTYKNGICTVCGEEDYDGLDLNGLNVLCLGDSITAGQGLTTETRWTNVLASKYGWNLTNKSQGGISLSSYYYTANGKSNVSIAKKAEILKTMTTKPDVIIVWGGHNDTSYRYSPLGTWDDETTDSFKGALKYIAELADEYAPDATLFVLTPLWTTEAPSTLKVPENTTDNNWMFVDAIYEGAEAYGWIPINMDLCGITPFTKSGLLLDNIHPNEAGTEKIVAYLSAELVSYGENSKKDTILFNKSDVSMKTGESTALKAVLSSRSGTGTVTFTWSSSDSSVATVDANGKIIAVAPGNAIITATTTNGISAGFGVSVVCEHTYATTVTAPTCTEQGYTTYTCACGDSYVDDYVDATGEHTYENGVCIGCGEIDPGWERITLGDFAVAGVGTGALISSSVQLSQKTLIAVPHPGAVLTVIVRDGYQACVYSGNNSNRINQNSGWMGADGDGKTACTYTLPESSIYMRLSIRRTDGGAITLEDLALSGLTVLYESTSDIVQDNSDVAEILKNTELPVLIHLSDIHGDVIRAERAASFAQQTGADALLASGDLTAYDPDDWGSALFDAVGKYADVNFVYGIGNHDAKISANVYQQTIYKSYFKDNPSTPNGETYYYRDLAEQKLRLISVNQQEGASTTTSGGTCYSQAQVDWLVETLKSTPAGYGVVLMYHSPETTIARAQNPEYSKFFQTGNRYDNPTNSYSGYSGTFLMDLVDAFMLRKNFTWSYSEKNGASPVTLNADFTNVAEGVEFIAHVTGHVHSDSITYLPGTACKQLLLGVTCTTSMYGADGDYYGLADYSDLNRQADNANQDAFNAYIIDRENKTVRVLRVGARKTVSGDTREDMTIPYSIPFEEGSYLFDTEGMVKLDLSDVEWVNYGIQEYGVEPTYKPGVRYSTNAIFDVPYEGVTFYIKINAPYELGIRSGATDTTMITNYYWLNNKSLTSGDQNRGYVYTIPAGHDKFILSFANVTRDSSNNVTDTNHPLNWLELQAAGVEVWYSPEPAEEPRYPFDTSDKVKLDLSDVEWVNYGFQAYGTEPSYLPGLRVSADMIFDVPYEGVTFYVKINAPYEIGIRSGETDTTMTTNHYWLNNKYLASGNNDRGYIYAIPAGHGKFILSVANITRNDSGNITSSNNPITLEELEAAGLEIWYVPGVEEWLPGDINGDGEVNNKDLTRLFRHLSGYSVEVVEAALDVNGDGEVNNKDLTRLFRYLSGYAVEIF